MWHMRVTLALMKLRQEDHWEFNATVNFIARPCPEKRPAKVLESGMGPTLAIPALGRLTQQDCTLEPEWVT